MKEKIKRYRVSCWCIKGNYFLKTKEEAEKQLIENKRLLPDLDWKIEEIEKEIEVDNRKVFSAFNSPI